MESSIQIDICYIHQALESLLPIDAPSTPLRTFCDDDQLGPQPTPQTIADHPFSSPSPINQSSTAPTHAANFVHYKKAIQGPDFPHWQESMHQEIVRLFVTTKTATYRPDLTMATIPAEARIGRANPIIVKKEDKLDPTKIEWRTRLTYDEIKRKNRAPHPTSSSTIDSLAVKLLYNSIVSDRKAILSSIDLKDFYLNSQCKKAYLTLINGLSSSQIKSSSRYNPFTRHCSSYPGNRQRYVWHGRRRTSLPTRTSSSFSSTRFPYVSPHTRIVFS